MTWVKICGITNREDAMTAVEAGADALGFVFYEKSPRNVAPETVREITAKLPVKMEKVGVFVDESAQGIDQSVERAGLTAAQLYRPDPAMEFIKYLQVRQQMNHPPRVISVIPGKSPIRKAAFSLPPN